VTKHAWTMLSAALALSLPILSASAQTAAEFYKGRTISLIIGGSEGGGYDTMARAIGRHLGRHIPGKPAIVSKNMPGASGMAATNYLYNAADKDGTVIGLLQNNNPLAQLFGNKQARFDATQFNWLGTPSIEVAVVVLWHAVPINSVDDLRTKETSMGASGVQSGQAFVGRLLNATLAPKCVWCRATRAWAISSSRWSAARSTAIPASSTARWRRPGPSGCRRSWPR